MVEARCSSATREARAQAAATAPTAAVPAGSTLEHRSRPSQDDAGPAARADALAGVLARAVASRTVPPGAVLARARHRAPLNGRIEFDGHTWTVTASDKVKPTITISRQNGKKTEVRTITWADADYWILRDAGQGHDFDMRRKDEDEPDAAESRSRWTRARDKALEMIKAYAAEHVLAEAKPALEAIAVTDFTGSKPTTNTDAGAQEFSEWSLEWIEKSSRAGARMRRKWKFTLDTDKPLATSDQEPHVGWEAKVLEKASGGKIADVDRALGHVWLDDVPVWRPA
jgi:hypothetical protein